MMNGLRSELLKYKRTFMGKLIVLVPVFFAGYALIMQATLMKHPLSQNRSWMWDNLLALIFNWWTFVFLPLGFALFAALAAGQEKKSGNYRALRSRNVSPMLLWIYKVAAMAVYSLLSAMVLTIAAILAGVLAKSGAIPADCSSKYCLLGGFPCPDSYSVVGGYVEGTVSEHGARICRHGSRGSCRA